MGLFSKVSELWYSNGVKPITNEYTPDNGEVCVVQDVPENDAIVTVDAAIANDEESYSDNSSYDSEEESAITIIDPEEQDRIYYKLIVENNSLELQILYTLIKYRMTSSKRLEVYKNVNRMLYDNGCNECENESDVKKSLMSMFADTDVDVKIEFEQYFNKYAGFKAKCKIISMTLEELNGRYRESSLNLSMQKAVRERQTMREYTAGHVTNEKLFIKSHKKYVKRAYNNRIKQRNVIGTTVENGITADMVEFYSDVKKTNVSRRKRREHVKQPRNNLTTATTTTTIRQKGKNVILRET